MKKTFGVTLTRFNLPGLTNTNGRFIRVIDVYINFMFEKTEYLTNVEDGRFGEW